MKHPAEVKGVSRVFATGAGRVIALADATMHVAAGEVVGLAGPSGSGKTTLVNLIIGWDQPDTGSVSRRSGTDRSWRHVAVVAQDLGVLTELSVAENIELPIRLGNPAQVEVGDLLTSLGLEALSERRPDELSLGEQQRVAVARAVICGPDLLVADEPTAHQDEHNADRVMALLRSVADRGAGVLVATHDDRVLDAVDRVIDMDSGVVSDPRDRTSI